MMIRAIKTEADYETALARVEEIFDSEPDCPEFDELEVWGTLIGAYEDENYSVPPPTPLEAIKFVMDQRGLKQKDLIPFIGSKSKVSEVSAGKRKLTLKMIRALHEGLGIPADTLLKDPGKKLPESLVDVDWSRFPVKEMVRRGWIENAKDLMDRAEESVRNLMVQVGHPDCLPRACYRCGIARIADDIDMYAVQAWLLGVQLKAQRIETRGVYEGNLNETFLSRLARLSMFSDGPLKAMEYLSSKGIKLVVEPHFQHTRLDGAVILQAGSPTLALTLRYDRIDNFWFTLLHECAHIIRHLSEENSLILDDLDSETNDEREHEANVLARDAAIPLAVWEDHKITKDKQPTKEQVFDLAIQLEIHPALVAGRFRYERKQYNIFSGLVGNREVRKIFFKS
ncbi:MAG: ImmA/IrrE family metallo-endopeptidase [Desulfonatronovibrio sp.]